MEIYLNKQVYAEYSLLISIFKKSRKEKGWEMFKFYISLFYMTCIGKGNYNFQLLSQEAIKTSEDQV